MRFVTQKNEKYYLAISYFKENKSWSISWMCKQLNISRSGYYKWLEHSKSKRELENEALSKIIYMYDQKYNHILGYRRMTEWINDDFGTSYNKKRVARIMSILGIKSVIRAKRKRLYYNPKETAHNVLNREFEATEPNSKWGTDVTEFKIWGTNKKLYLSAILDFYDKSIVSHVISTKNNNKLVMDTLHKAFNDNPNATPLIHSDRGNQYTSLKFKALKEQYNFIHSMSRVKCCIDNGPMEGFWGMLKSEMYYLNKFYSEQELIDAIDNYIYFYNYERKQSRYKCKTPMEVRMAAINNKEQPELYPIAENKRIIQYKQELKLKLLEKI